MRNLSRADWAFLALALTAQIYWSTGFVEQLLPRNLEHLDWLELPLSAELLAKADGIIRGEILARKAENLLALSKSGAEHVEFLHVLELTKEEIAKQIESNFLRTLAVVLVTGPVRAQQRQDEILRLMQAVLNGQLDFRVAVDKLPFLARQSETNRFIELLKCLRESERTGTVGQNDPAKQPLVVRDMGKILDAMAQVTPRQIGDFLKEMPELFEGVQAIIDGVQEYF